MNPCEATSLKKVCDLKRDNLSIGDSWVMIDGDHVTIMNQKTGEDATGDVTLSYAQMRRFARWFLFGEVKPKNKKHVNKRQSV